MPLWGGAGGGSGGGVSFAAFAMGVVGRGGAAAVVGDGDDHVGVAAGEGGSEVSEEGVPAAGGLVASL